ncbi:ribonuclease [Sporobolomyces salmoneus]|uniref:ribonuclease n=1 Tax=Sporobolomyces salmoneus TaxID=183962 RepID=UPI00317F826D
MSSSLVHLGIAASAGLVLGAAGAFSVSRKQSPPPSTSSPSGSTGRPENALPSLAGQGKPAEVYHGGLTGRDLRTTILSGSTIGPVSDILVRTGYTAAYDRRNRIPAWTAEHLTKDSLKSGGGDRNESRFTEDEDVPKMFRAGLLDYFKSGYDRGHMASRSCDIPAYGTADCKSSQTAMSETFLLSNIAPQVGEGFNRHYWAYTEAFCRNLTKDFDDVYVFTVPLFLPKKDLRDGKWKVSYEMIAPQNGPPSIAVPTHFAKVILASRPPRVSSLSLVPSSATSNQKEWVQGAFVLPNEPIPDYTKLENFIVPVESVERSAGLNLLPEEMKGVKELCKTIKCEVVVRRFDDAQKKLGGNNGNGGGRPKVERRQSI